MSSLFPYRKSLVYLAAAVFALSVLVWYRCEGFCKRELLCIFSMLGTGLLCACITREFTLVISVFYIFAFMNVDRAGLFQNLLLEKVGFLAVSAVCSVAGIISTQSGSYERLYSFFGEGTVYRRSLGFTNYNILGLIVFELMILYVLYMREKYERNLKAGEYVLLIGTVFRGYIVSGSRTALIGGNGRQCSAERYVLCIMLAVSIYNISENVLVFPTINFALLYLADVVSGSPKVQGTANRSQESVERKDREEEQAVPWNR